MRGLNSCLRIRIKRLMRRSNCSDPIPPGHHFFLGCPGLLITLLLPCPALCKHSDHSFFSAQPLFITLLFSLTKGLPREGMGAEKFDRRISTKRNLEWILLYFFDRTFLYATKLLDFVIVLFSYGSWQL